MGSALVSDARWTTPARPAGPLRPGHASWRDRRARWFASTTPAANEARPGRRGAELHVVHNGDKFTLKDAVGLHGAEMIGSAMWDKYKKWPVYSKFFDNLGPIPHHMHQTAEQAAAAGS